MITLASCSSEQGRASTHASADSSKSAGSNPRVAALPEAAAQDVGFVGARHAWMVSNTAAGDVGGAAQSGFLDLAATDLRLGLSRDLSASTPAGEHAYRAAIRNLLLLAWLPDTSLTQRQRSEYDEYVTRLNVFFGTRVPGGE
jgi:hypothetical protein